ncbi:MAG: diguanylate cyclase [Syntrophobacterales bacterium]|nr:diguanylate cyclase [Syntrophobacterales bacterium]
MGGAYLYQKSVLTEESITKAAEISRVIKAALKGQMFTHNTQLTQTLVDEVNTFSNVDDIYIINHEGVVKFSQNHSLLGEQFFKERGECRQCHHDATGKKHLTLQTRNSHGDSVLRNVTHIYNEAACYSCHPGSQRILGLLFVDYSTTDTDAFIASTLWRVFLTAVAAFIVLSLVVFYIANHLIYNTIRLLIDGTREIIKGNYNKQISYQGNREFAALANSFNDMSSGIVRRIGAASCPKSGTEVKDILLAADEALYKAKETGRNKVVFG